METVRKPLNEDRVALLLGSVIFILALLKFSGIDMLGWAVKIGMWVGDPLDAWRPATKGLLPGYGALFATYAILTGALACCVKLMGNDVVKFVKSFTIIFFIAMICYTLGANAYIAANPTQLKAQGIPWALGLSTEAGLILALVMGIVISNFMPNLAESLKDACRPELFVKIAIVIMGAELGVKAADAAGFAGHIIFRGLCAIVEAYLLYWCVVYYVARRYFKVNREWAAPLASGISICGVSAAIATGAAIRSRPVVPIMVSSLVVVFTCIEMLILPFIAQHFLTGEPMVAGGWMGLAVKSDGGAIASGAIAESLILAKAAEAGWALVLAWVWCTKFDKSGDRTMHWGDVWARFPRFVLGYIITFAILLIICLQSPELQKTGASVSGTLNAFRVIFFLLTFFTIGMVSNFRKLMEEGIGRLAIVYVVCLFGFIIWLGLFISWLFFHGMTPPLAS